VGGAQIYLSADVDGRAEIGPGTTVLARIRENARLGGDCIVGRARTWGPA
jgi:UDP-2-acetamido-3-amino-2,3-dideoxy-glucuronate N-acetyltransferase